MYFLKVYKIYFKSGCVLVADVAVEINVFFTFVFSQFLAYDTQLIMGGKKHELSQEDYVFAALMLYVDVVYIFMFIMALLGKK